MGADQTAAMAAVTHHAELRLELDLQTLHGSFYFGDLGACGLKALRADGDLLVELLRLRENTKPEESHQKRRVNTFADDT